MAAYLLARVEVRDMQQYRKYTQRTPEVIAQFGGRFLVRGGEVVTLEGPESTERIVLIEFPSLAQVQAFYASPEYQAAKELRLGVSDASFLALAGVE